MTKFNGKALKVGALGLAALMTASFTTVSMAQGQESKEAPQAQHAPRMMDPYSEQTLDRMATTLQLDAKTRTKASELFSEARKDRQDVVTEMQKLRGPMISLNPSDDDYVDQVENIAEQRSELMVKLDVQQAEVRHKLYGLLSDEQIKTLESLGGHR